MKNINITNIVDPTSLQPFTGNSLKFLQDATAEARAGMIKAFVTQNLGSYSLTVPYVIDGCVVSDSGKDVTDGEIFYGGEYYELTGVNGTTNIAQFSVVKTQDATADPLDFSDGQTHNVHDIFKFVGTDTATAGTFDSSELTSVYGAGKLSTFVEAATASVSSTSWADLATATYTTPNDGKTRTWAIVGKASFNFTPVTSSSTDGGSLKLVVDGVDKDESIARLNSTIIGGSSINNVYITSLVLATMSVPPNKVIKLQVKSFSGGTVSIEYGRFSVIEL